ncbi:MAG: GNAT family N-acetyltransferase [Myxococcota bacterium]
MFKTQSIEQFQLLRADFEEAVLKTQDISKVCSAYHWQHAAYYFLDPSRQLFVVNRDGYWFVSCVGPIQRFKYVLQPLEMRWAFGCPLVGEDPYQAALFVEEVLRQHSMWDMAIFTGLPEFGELEQQLSKTLGKFYTCELFEGSHCDQARIEQGLDMWLSRRSRSFRANLRRSARRAQEQDIRFVPPEPEECGETLFQRIMRIETQSWKSQSKQSIYQSPMYHNFYRELCVQMSLDQSLHVLFAKQHDRDIGYVYGGVLGPIYRGFQLTYDEEFAPLGIGNLLQWEMLQRLADEYMELYDLGMEMDYKKKWADQLQRFRTLLVFPF